MKKINFKSLAKKLGIVIAVYALTTLFAFVLDTKNFHAENLLTLYLLGTIIIVMETKSFVITILSSLLFIMTHNYMFLDPKYDWHPLTNQSFALSAALFLIVALIVNLLVVRLQRQVKASKQSANLHKKLYKASEGLISISGREHVIAYADRVLTELTGCDVRFFFDVDKHDSDKAKVWCVKNSAKCGHGEVEFSESPYKYLPIRSNKKTVGAVAIDCSTNELSEEAEECVTALLSQITIAIERENLEEELKVIEE